MKLCWSVPTSEDRLDLELCTQSRLPVVIQVLGVAANYFKHQLEHEDWPRHYAAFFDFLSIVVGVSGNFDVDHPPDFDLSKAKRPHESDLSVEAPPLLLQVMEVRVQACSERP